MEENSEKLTTLYKEIVKANGILDPISNVAITVPNLREEGILSDRQLVTVTFEDPNLQPLHLFTKTHVSGNPSHVELSLVMKVFEKESRFLTKYVPAVSELCKRKGVDEKFLAEIYPKCYYGDEEIIVLENIAINEGFKVFGKTERHNLELASLALVSLAKQHAVSYALIQEEGGPEKFFLRFPNLNHESMGSPQWCNAFEPWLQAVIKTNISILEKNIHLDGITEAIAELREINNREETLCDLMKKSLETNDNELHLLNHGDYWYANMMFSRDSISGKITRHKALDFQIVRYNSPAHDLVYYLFTSVTTAVRQNHFQELFQLYLNNLNALSRELGHPTNMDYDTLFSLYRTKLYDGYLCSLFLNYGPGMSLFKEIDLTKIESSEWGAVVDKLSDQWIKENPVEAVTIAEELVKVIKEFCDLELK